MRLARRTCIRNVANSLSTFAPTIDQRTGNFSTCGAPCNRVLRDPLGGNFPNNQIPVSRFDPAAVKVNSLIPAVGGDGFTVIGRPINWQQDQVVGKGRSSVDQQGPAQRAVFHRSFQERGHLRPVAICCHIAIQHWLRACGAQSGVVTWTRTISPTLLNDFHFGFNRIHAARGPFFDGRAEHADAGCAAARSIRRCRRSRRSRRRASSTSATIWKPSSRAPAFEWGNRTSWVHGRHNVQFGGEVSRQRVDIVNEFRRARPLRVQRRRDGSFDGRLLPRRDPDVRSRNGRV